MTLDITHDDMARFSLDVLEPTIYEYDIATPEYEMTKEDIDPNTGLVNVAFSTDPSVISHAIQTLWREGREVNQDLLEYWYNLCRYQYYDSPFEYQNCYQAYYNHYNEMLGVDQAQVYEG